MRGAEGPRGRGAGVSTCQRAGGLALRHLGILAFCSASAFAQAPGATDMAIRIVSPTDDAYVTGPVLLRVLVDPPVAVDRLAQVSFYANGRQVCEVEEPPYECAWDAGPGIRSHHVRAVATTKDGARLFANVHTKSAEFAEQVDVDVVQVTAVVTDADGRFVDGLTRQSFRVYEDGRPQPITFFAAENIPLDIVVAVDVSSSMTDAMPQVKRAVKRFLEALRPDDRVTLIAFNHNVFTLARQENNPAARARAVDRLASWGGTALYDAIVRGLELLRNRQGRRSLVIFTDGEDQSSRNTEAEVLRTVEASDATLFLIGQGRGARMAPLIAVQERLARVSGGRSFQAEKADQLEDAFAQIVEELSHQYLLGYPPPSLERDSRWRAIRVELIGGNNGSHRVRARQGYRASKDR